MKEQVKSMQLCLFCNQLHGQEAKDELVGGKTDLSMFSEPERYYGLGMDAPVIVCSRNTNVIMV